MKISTVIIDQSQVIISVMCTPLSCLKYNSVLIGAGIWHQRNSVRHLHDTRTRNQHQKMELICGAGFWSMCHVPRFICMCVLASSVSV